MRRHIGRLWPVLLVTALAASGASPSPTSEELAERRTRIVRMEPNAQQELLRKFERFSALPAEEQRRLSALQAAISADPNSERLHQVLERYHEWLKTITPSQRATLAELPAEKRVEEIERIRRRQRDDQNLDLLSRQDMREIMRWIDELVKKHRQELVAGIPEKFRSWYDKETDPRRKQMALIYRMFGRSRGDQHESRVTQDDIDRLAKKLSEPARAEIGKAGTLEEQRKVVSGWIFATLRRNDSWQGGRRANPVVGEELLEFLQNEVAPARREQLLKMPREEMLRELRKMYFERGSGEGRFPPGRRPDNPRGPNRSKGPRGDGPDDRSGPEKPGPSDSAPAPFFN
ncbi:MAG: hypothetical protein WDZ48_06110 [Pirellulales bacterium]